MRGVDPGREIQVLRSGFPSPEIAQKPTVCDRGDSSCREGGQSFEDDPTDVGSFAVAHVSDHAKSVLSSESLFSASSEVLPIP